jgi:hypothetical protein
LLFFDKGRKRNEEKGNEKPGGEENNCEPPWKGRRRGKESLCHEMRV